MAKRLNYINHGNRYKWVTRHGIPIKLSRKGVILPSGKEYDGVEEYQDYDDNISNLSEAGLVSKKGKLLTGSVCKMCKGKGYYGDAICENCYGVGKSRNKNFGIGITGRYQDRREHHFGSS